jgi:DNA invertase Pin-like site-specific DNA recombinase
LRRLAAENVPQRIIARKYGIAPATVSRIVNRKLWSHI